MKNKSIRVAALKILVSALVCASYPGFNSAAAQIIIPSSETQVKYAYIADFKGIKTLSDEDLSQLLYCSGFKGMDLIEAWSVAKKESNGRPLAYNGNIKTGDNSYGVFQINMIGSMGGDRREKFNLTYNKDLLDPWTNATIAFHMSNGGKNWSAWHGLTPKTKQIMSKYPNSFTPLECKWNNSEIFN
jgi:hypothetical protein